MDNEKLDLILETLNGMNGRIDRIESDIQDIKKDTGGLKRQLMKSTAELKAMDEMIFDEVERVHSILDKHKADKSTHTA